MSEAERAIASESSTPEGSLVVRTLLAAAVVAVSALAMPLAAEARACPHYGTTSDGSTIKVDVSHGASCSFAKATAARFYASDGVPRRLNVQGIRLTRQPPKSGSGWVKWRYEGGLHGRTAVVIITQVGPSPSPPRSPASPLPPLPSSPVPECDPNYRGACLNPTVADYDCLGGSGDGPLYTGAVAIVGYDHYGLDADGDGKGCERS